TISVAIYSYISVLFFFSSRRRHTRCYRDWSSDVCSSDLSLVLGMLAPAPRIKTVGFVSAISNARLLELKRVLGFIEHRQPQRNRSEERRVGKECRSRWWTEEINKITMYSIYTVG